MIVMTKNHILRFIQICTLLIVFGNHASYKKPSTTILFEACRTGNVTQLQTYIDLGGVLTVEDEKGIAPLFLATAYGHLPIVELLVKHGACIDSLDRIGDNPLKYAAFYGHVSLVLYFLEHHSPLDQQDKEYRRTALLEALINGHTACAKELILHGANVNLADKDGNTPLIVATKHTMFEIIQLLIKHQAAVNAYDATGATALTYAYEHDLQEIATYLEAHGAQATLVTPASMRYKLKRLAITETTKALILQKITQFEQLQSGNSHETENLRQMLQYIFRLPWGKIHKTEHTFVQAQAILDADHAHMKNVKDEILDYIALYMANPHQHPPVLCLVGPAGIGKTSLAQSLAKALNRKFHRIAVGGVSDGATLRGHPRVYVGAEPGLFTKGLMSAESMNPVLLIDEIDKMSPMSMHGNPYAVLLELLDPEQNAAFRDENLTIPIPFSDVIFITTANSLDSIPRPLLDRMKIIHLSSYTVAEKITIIQDHLIKKITEECGMDRDELKLSPELISYLIHSYTHEAGVREIARILKTMCAKIARAKFEGKTVELTQKEITTFLGPAHPESNISDHQPSVGLVNGLAWTAYGGSTLAIETVIMKGNGKLKLTGNLGTVMKESAEAALSYIRAHAQELHIDSDMFSSCDIHIHVPEGAVPKDGPSAGITMLVSLISACTKKAVDGYFAMTGEINLRGYVEPIGGLKEKIIAAKYAGFTHVCAPLANQYDLIQEPEVLDGITVHWVKHVDDVLKLVLL